MQTKTIVTSTPSGDSCCSCCSTSSCNPKNWDVAEWKKAAEIAAAIFAICAVAIVISALMIKFPQASGIFYAIFGVAAVLSLIAFIVGVVKCRAAKEELKELKNEPIK